MNDGYNNPFMAPRGITNMDEISYKINYKKLSMQKYLEKVSLKCRKRFKYYMNVQEEIEEEEDDATT